MLVDPTATLPKVMAAGLMLSAPEGVVLEFVVAELLFALVKPVHPVRIDAPDTTVRERNIKNDLCLTDLVRPWRDQPRDLVHGQTFRETLSITSAP